MGMPAWGETARMAIAEAKGGGGYKGSYIEPTTLAEFLAFIAEEWEGTEPEEFSPNEWEAA